MATFQSLGITIAGGASVFAVSLAAFGYAIANQSVLLAPRCAARPPQVIFNKDNKRGSAMFGWIPWTLSLTYAELLHGIPGTGTRKGGLEGSLLKVNMDGIVMLRFHALCRRMAFMAAFLFLVVLLPSYYSAQCSRNGNDSTTGSSTSTFWLYPTADGSTSNQTYQCDSPLYNLTDYERTTMANVPPASKTNLADNSITLGRLFGTTIMFWILLAYSMYILNQEWIQLLAMRRVYYLEYDVWGERRKELIQTLLYETDTNKKDDIKKDDNDEEEDYLIHRDPWIPHPEQRDTVPNIALYSLLVGGLPSLPQQSGEGVDPEAAVNYSKRASMDWQLSLTTTFFDHCVPNMPGFSSSVAALTIIPSASDLTEAWRKWYRAAGKLRRLRFIRQQILEKRRQYDIEADYDDECLDDKESEDTKDERLPAGANKLLILPFVDTGLGVNQIAAYDDDDDIETPRPIYKVLDEKQAYYRQVFGSIMLDEADERIYETICYGPEQAAVYSREFAQAASPCCPNGCREGRVLNARMEELLEMEKRLISEVQEANVELKEIRHRMAMSERAEINIPQASVHGPASPIRARIDTELFEKDGLGLEAKLFKTASMTKEKIYRERNARSLSPVPFANLEVGQVPVTANGVPASIGHTVDECDESSKPRSRARGEVPPHGNEWDLVESIVTEAVSRSTKGCNDRPKIVTSGEWSFPRVYSIASEARDRFLELTGWAKNRSAEAINTLARHSTYAVVTFTSRQAAVAARNCLADGRGAQRWVTLSDMPIPPLADAAACDLKACRNCCRPVTVSINDRQKQLRFFCALVMLAAIYIFYTIPLTFASSLVSEQNIRVVFPGLAHWSKTSLGFSVTELLSGLISSMITTGFLASCPVLFKSISNFGSGAVSVAQAEFAALQYFWYFMLITAFSGQLLISMILNGFANGLTFGPEFKRVLRSIASTIPSTISATWLHWLLYRTLITLPLMYLLNVNAYLFKWFRMKCCSRAMIGGGAGGQTPYRIYVDSGTALMCTFALGPAAPLIALASLAYFLIMEPLLRRNLIFVYRPKFDGGGSRWPFLFDMIISVFIYAEILLTTQLVLKEAIVPSIMAALPIIPTYVFQITIKKRYLRAYKDAALLQTSLLDGWDVDKNTSAEKREEFRRFLVDAHKAAYVPVCIAGSDTDYFLTAEPAVVLPDASDVSNRDLFENFAERDVAVDDMAEESVKDGASHLETMSLTTVPKPQHGATLRRSVHVLSALHRVATPSPLTVMSPLNDGSPLSGTGQALRGEPRRKSIFGGAKISSGNRGQSKSE